MKKWAIYGLCAISLITGGYQASAEDSDTSQLAGGYTIEGVPSDHQLDKEASYFYLKEEPGENDQVKIKLTNDSSEDKVLEVKITNANTNSNGLIDYSGQLKDHVSLKNPLTSIAKVSQDEVKVPAKSSVETIINIQMPNQTLPGVIVGGILVSEKEEEKNKDEGLSLGNVYTYTLGLVLTNESKVEPKKNISVELDNVGAILFDGRKIVQANILNNNPYMFTEGTIKGKIIDQKTNKVVQNQEKSNINIAPYSVFPFQFDWGKENLKSGKYLFKGAVEAGDKVWEFEEEFEITADKAKEINEESVFKVYIPNWLTYSVYGFGTISILGTSYLLFQRKSKK